MNFYSTRNHDLSVSFSQAARQCTPPDGGIFVPSEIEDLRRWIYYIDETTSFSSIAGTLTSAMIKDEFSPIICERIATRAFSFEPRVRQLDDKLFTLELFHGITGNQKDYGVSFLCSYLETTLQLTGGKALFLDYTHGSLGAILAKSLKNKKNIKAVLVYKKDEVSGLEDSDFVWNGGNIYPVEMEGSEEEIKAIISSIFEDPDFVAKYNLTVANTTNVCRLMAQMFFFPYSFSRIKNRIHGDIYYALDGGNYGTIMAGLYSWRSALPLSGFFVPSTSALGIDASGNPILLDSFVSLKRRNSASPILPANLERLEDFFSQNQLMLRNFVFPINITEEQTDQAAKDLFINYGIFADKETARAYACAKENCNSIYDDEGSIVLVQYNHPSLSYEYCLHTIGEAPELPQNIKASKRHIMLNRPIIETKEQLIDIIKNIN